MIGIVKTDEKGHTIITYVRENWKEWFRFFKVMYEVGEGECYPKFYLPVSREYNRDRYMCWILPLAPFVLVWIAFWRAFKSFWQDLITVIDKWG